MLFTLSLLEAGSLIGSQNLTRGALTEFNQSMFKKALVNCGVIY